MGPRSNTAVDDGNEEDGREETRLKKSQKMTHRAVYFSKLSLPIYVPRRRKVLFDLMLLLLTPLQPKKAGTTRKGAARTSMTDSPDVVDKPSNPKYPSTFINIESNEWKLTAYIGFNDIAHARTLIMSWPVLKALTSSEPIARNINEKAAFKLLHSAEHLFQNVEDPLHKWPLHDTDTKEQA
jgi:hypothetical protein